MMFRPTTSARRPSRFSIPGLALLTTLVLGPMLAGCGGGSGDESGGEEAGPDSTEDSALVPVAIHVLERGDASALVQAWGTVRPSRQADILAEVSGQVIGVRVGLGDRVQKGQVLIETDPELFTARRHEAESLAKSAGLAKDKAKRDLERGEAMFERGTISDSEIEAIRTRTAEAEAGYASAQSGLEQARKNLASARLRAPFDGHVASRPPDPGSTVNLGVPLITVVDIDRVRIEAQVSEQDLARIRPGVAVQVTTEGVPGRLFTGTLAAVGPQADASTRQFPVEVEVDNRPEHLLKGGMVARVEIVHETVQSRPLLPLDALVETASGLVCFLVRDGVAHEVVPVLGPRQDRFAALLDGAAAGDSVVVLGQTRLAEGSRVRVEEIR